MGVELCAVTRKLAEDPNAMQTLKQNVHRALYLETYIAHATNASSQAAFRVYSGFNRSTLLLVIFSAACSSSGGIVSTTLTPILDGLD